MRWLIGMVVRVEQLVAVVLRWAVVVAVLSRLERVVVIVVVEIATVDHWNRETCWWGWKVH